MHLSQLHKIVERGEFSLRFVSQAGELITVPRCVCTSFYSKGRTMNIKLCESGQTRTIVRNTIVEINGEEAYL